MKKKYSPNILDIFQDFRKFWRFCPTFQRFLKSFILRLSQGLYKRDNNFLEIRRLAERQDHKFFLSRTEIVSTELSAQKWNRKKLHRVLVIISASKINLHYITFEKFKLFTVSLEKHYLVPAEKVKTPRSFNLLSNNFMKLIYVIEKSITLAHPETPLKACLCKVASWTPYGYSTTNT